jgi:hypothetical protein
VDPTIIDWKSIEAQFDPTTNAKVATLVGATQIIASALQGTPKIRSGSDLNPQEKAINARRLAIAGPVIVKFLGTLALKKDVRVMVAFSGGSEPAATGSSGFLLGMQDIGMLDGIMSISAISGGTWTLGSWIAHGENPAALRKRITNIGNIFPRPVPDYEEIVALLLAKGLTGRPVT